MATRGVASQGYMPMPSTGPTRKSTPAHRRQGRILPGLVPVCLLLLILLGLVVGVYGPWRRPGIAQPSTLATARIAMRAVAVYREATGSYPAESSEDCVSLMETISPMDASREVVRDLSVDFWNGPGTPLRDGFGEPMVYEPPAQTGGEPVLISRGPDRQLGTPDDIRCGAR